MRDLDTIKASCEREKALLEERVLKAKNRYARTLASSGGFRAERRTRLRSGDRPRGGSADSHRDWWTLDRLRRDCQQLARNNPIARGVVRRLAESVAGTIRFTPASGDARFDDEVSRRFNDWAGDAAQCDTRGLVSLWDHGIMAVEAACVDGAAVLLKTKSAASADSAERLALQTIEIERLRNPLGIANDRTHVNGIELDNAGRPVRVHVAEWNADGSYAAHGTEPRPWRDVCYLPNPLHRRPGQTVAEPALAASVEKLEAVDDFIDNTLAASKVAASIAMVTNTMDPATADSALGVIRNSLGADSRPDGESGGPETFDLEPGMLLKLALGEDAKTFEPKHPGPQFDPFVVMMIRMVAQDLGLPLELAFLDFSRTNFHSARSANAIAWRGFNVWRRWLFDRLHQPVYAWVVSEWIRGGLVAPPRVDNWRESYWRCEWTGGSMPVLDPEREAKAAKILLDERIADRDTIIAEMGRGGFDTTIEQIEYEQREMERRKVLPIAMPGAQTPDDEPDDDEGDDAQMGLFEEATA